MPTLNTDDDQKSVEKALEVYKQWSRQIAPYVDAAVAGKVEVPRQTVSAEVWITLALYWEGSNKTLENLVRDADVVGHSLPSAEEIGWTLLMLKDRGWLSNQRNLYGLTEEGMHVVESVVGEGSSLREQYRRLTEWVSSHPASRRSKEEG